MSVASTSKDDEDDLGDEVFELHQAMVNGTVANSDEVVSWRRVKEAANQDDICMVLNDAIRDGFPKKKSEAVECLRPYYRLKDDLYTLEGVPCIDGRVFIPKPLRREVLAGLHSAHQGVSGMKAVSRGRFWWLGMKAILSKYELNADIETRSRHLTFVNP